MEIPGPHLVPQFTPEELQHIRHRQECIANNFSRNIALRLNAQSSGEPNQEGFVLRAHQSPSLEEVSNHFEETTHELGRRVLWPAPPNFGKSLMGMYAAQAAGVGQTIDGDRRPLKGLAFTSRDVGRKQIIGAADFVSQKLGLETPLRVAPFLPGDSPLAIDNADILVLTYQGATTTTEAKLEYLLARTDMWILDEIHRGIGERMLARLNRGFATYGATGLAMSATTEYDKDKTVAKALGITRAVSAITPQEAIDMGVSNGIWMQAVATGQTVDLKSRRGSVTDAAMAPLIENDERNNLIADFMQCEGYLGDQGLAWCIPGRNNRHADIIADMASDRRIIDPVTGDSRNLRVESIGVHKPPSEIEELMRRMREGVIDALAFCRYLIEALDHDGIRYLLAANPSRSQVDMGQFVGRGSRVKSEDSRLTDIYYLVDTYYSRRRRRLVTPFDVFGADCYQGQFIATPDQVSSHERVMARRGRVGGAQGPRRSAANEDLFLPPLEMSECAQRAVEAIAPGTTLDELLITGKERPLPPEGYIPVADLNVVQEGKVTTTGLHWMLQKLGEHSKKRLIVQAYHEGAIRFFVSPEARDIAEERYSYGSRIRRMEIGRFLELQGWPAPSLDGLLTMCDEVGVMFDDHRKELSLSRNDTKKLLDHITRVPLVDPSREVIIGELGREMGLGSSEMHKYFRRYFELNEQPDTTVERRRGKPRQVYRVVTAAPADLAIDVAAWILSRSPRAHSIITNPRKLPSIVEKLRQSHALYYERNGIRPWIGHQAIASFIDSGNPDVPRDPDTREAGLAADTPSSTADSPERIATKGPDTMPTRSQRNQPEKLPKASTAGNKALPHSPSSKPSDTTRYADTEADNEPHPWLIYGRQTTGDPPSPSISSPDNTSGAMTWQTIAQFSQQTVLPERVINRIIESRGLGKLTKTDGDSVLIASSAQKVITDICQGFKPVPFGWLDYETAAETIRTRTTMPADDVLQKMNTKIFRGAQNGTIDLYVHVADLRNQLRQMNVI